MNRTSSETAATIIHQPKVALSAPCGRCAVSVFCFSRSLVFFRVFKLANFRDVCVLRALEQDRIRSTVIWIGVGQSLASSGGVSCSLSRADTSILYPICSTVLTKLSFCSTTSETWSRQVASLKTFRYTA